MSHQIRASLMFSQPSLPQKDHWLTSFGKAVCAGIKTVWDLGKRIFAKPTIYQEVKTLDSYTESYHLAFQEQNVKPVTIPATIRSSTVDIRPIQTKPLESTRPDVPVAPAQIIQSRITPPKYQPQPKKAMPKAPKVEIQAKPEILNRTIPTFMDNPRIIGNAFQLVANQQDGKVVSEIEGIETNVNQTLSVALSTKRAPQGLGISITTSGAMLIWHKNADLDEINRLRLQIQKMYLAIAMIHSLKDNLGYDITSVNEGENIVVITAEKNKREVTVLLDAATGDIVNDFAHFQKLTCIDESEKLLEALSAKGVDYQPMCSVPKDDNGVLLFDMAIGEVTIDDHSNDNDRHLIIETFRKLGIQANVEFDSPCG